MKDVGAEGASTSLSPSGGRRWRGSTVKWTLAFEGPPLLGAARWQLPSEGQLSGQPSGGPRCHREWHAKRGWVGGNTHLGVAH